MLETPCQRQKSLAQTAGRVTDSSKKRQMLLSSLFGRDWEGLGAIEGSEGCVSRHGQEVPRLTGLTAGRHLDLALEEVQVLRARQAAVHPAQHLQLPLVVAALWHTSARPRSRLT